MLGLAFRYLVSPCSRHDDWDLFIYLFLYLSLFSYVVPSILLMSVYIVLEYLLYFSLVSIYIFVLFYLNPPAPKHQKDNAEEGYSSPCA